MMGLVSSIIFSMQSHAVYLAEIATDSVAIPKKDRYMEVNMSLKRTKPGKEFSIHVNVSATASNRPLLQNVTNEPISP